MSLNELFAQNEYLLFVLILATTLFIAQIFTFLSKKILKKIVKRTKNKIDDIILNDTANLLFILILAIGSYFAFKTLKLPELYNLWIMRVFFVFFILIFSAIFSKIITISIARWFKVQKKFEKMPQLISKIINIAIYLIASLIILSHFNIEITPLIATLGLGGLAIGLALQDTLSNLFAGLHIISDKFINVNDFIELEEGVSGYVEDVGWRSTKIKTITNNIIVVPNSKLAKTTLTNYSLIKKELGVLVECGVSYNSNLEKVEKVTIDVAKKIQKKTSGAVKDYKPFIRYNEFGDSNINFTVYLQAEEYFKRFIIKHEFIKELKARYDKEKIEISWPIRKIYYGDKKKK